MARDFTSMDDEEALGAIQATIGRLQSSMEEQKSLWRQLDAWHNLWTDELDSEIWGDLPDTIPHRNAYDTVIASTGNTVEAFFSSERPKITVMPRNSASLSEQDQSSFNERVGYALQDTLDMHRDEATHAAIYRYLVRRGYGILKSLWLSPEERGEEREKRPIELPGGTSPIASVAMAGVEPEAAESEADFEEIILSEGHFPLQQETPDPLDCAWEIDRWGEVITFVYEYTDTWASVLSTFSDILDKPGFSDMEDAAEDQDVTVQDYWDATWNAVIVDGRFYKPPTEHLYPTMPITVQAARVNTRRGGGNGSSTKRQGVPFCYEMLTSVANTSWIRSMESTYLQQAIFYLVKHRGLTEQSPYWVQPDDPEEEPRYQAVVNIGPGQQIFPLFNNEDLEFMETPPISAIAQQYKLDNQRDIAMVGFHDAILTGVMPQGPSGYSVYQQTIATKSRVEPYRLAGERLLSRHYQKNFRIIGRWWDLGDKPLSLMRMTGGKNPTVQTYEVTGEDFANVGTVIVQVPATMPFDNENERQQLFQAHSQGLASDLTAIDRLGFAQNPGTEMKRIAFENVAKKNPNFELGLAIAYAEENNIRIPGMEGLKQQQQQVAQQESAAMLGQPDPMMGAMPPGAMPPGMPPGPMPPGMGPTGMPPQAGPVDPLASSSSSLPPGGPVPSAGPPPEEELDPRLLAMLSQARTNGNGRR